MLTSGLLLNCSLCILSASWSLLDNDERAACTSSTCSVTVATRSTSTKCVSSSSPLDRINVKPALDMVIRDVVVVHALANVLLGRDRKSTRLNSSHYCASRLPSSA